MIFFNGNFFRMLLGLIHWRVIPGVLFVLLMVSACALMDVAREVQGGRRALQKGEPEAAIPHFEAAARLNPEYITDFTLADIGIWTYLGRAYFEAGDRARAAEALIKATAHSRKDYFGRIYLGLLQVEDGRVKEGKTELEAGLKGLGGWLKKVPGYGRQGRFWDPGRVMAKRVSESLAMLNREPIDWQSVREDVLWLGAAFDEEIDEVKRQNRMEREVRQRFRRWGRSR